MEETKKATKKAAAAAAAAAAGVTAPREKVDRPRTEVHERKDVPAGAEAAAHGGQRKAKFAGSKRPREEGETKDGALERGEKGEGDRVEDAVRATSAPRAGGGKGKGSARPAERAEEKEGSKDGEGEKKEDAEGEKKRAGANAVFVGNLPFTATEEEVLQFFRACNPIEFRRLTKRDGSFKGAGFLETSDGASVAKALLLHHSPFPSEGGRKINVELTAGGGGKGEARMAKIKAKNEALQEERRRRFRTSHHGKEGERGGPPRQHHGKEGERGGPPRQHHGKEGDGERRGPGDRGGASPFKPRSESRQNAPPAKRPFHGKSFSPRGGAPAQAASGDKPKSMATDAPRPAPDGAPAKQKLFRGGGSFRKGGAPPSH